jgi:RNA polymerase sigma factor for flagellar operon FliA
LKSKAYRYQTELLNAGNHRLEESEFINREKMIQTYTPLIKFIAHRLAMRLPSHISVEDLISAGMVGLLDAISKFDSKKKVKFETYAEYRIRGAMLDELRSLDWVPRSVRQKASHIERLIEELEKKKGGPVWDEEIAKAMGISIDEYYELMNEVQGVSLFDVKGLKSRVTQISDEDLIQLLLDEEENDPYHNFSLKEMKEILSEAIMELSEKEKLIVSLYYYEELTLKEIGEVLDLTESRICQLHNNIILKLRAKLKRRLKEAWDNNLNP